MLRSLRAWLSELCSDFQYGISVQYCMEGDTYRLNIKGEFGNVKGHVLKIIIPVDENLYKYMEKSPKREKIICFKEKG